MFRPSGHDRSLTINRSIILRFRPSGRTLALLPLWYTLRIKTPQTSILSPFGECSEIPNRKSSIRRAFERPVATNNAPETFVRFFQMLHLILTNVR